MLPRNAEYTLCYLSRKLSTWLLIIIKSLNPYFEIMYSVVKNFNLPTI